jgi:hypothetical protein
LVTVEPSVPPSTLTPNGLAAEVPSYTLSFNAPAGDHPNQYHHLQVKIGKPGLFAQNVARSLRGASIIPHFPFENTTETLRTLPTSIVMRV